VTEYSDAAARHQIIHDTGRNLFVEAGAGSGKTHLLVQRILTLVLEDGVPLSSVAAITFTEKAAGELVARVRRALQEIAETGRMKLFKEFREFPGATARAQRALEELPGAALETLHSFCLRLIQMFPLEAGVPPLVRKSDDLGDSFASVDRHHRLLGLVNGVFTGAADEEIRDLDCGVSPADLRESIEVLLDNGVRLHNITDLADWMDEHWGELASTMEAPLAPAGQPVDRDFLGALQSELRALRATCTVDDDKLAVAVNELITTLSSLCDDPTVDLQQVEPVLKAGGRGGTKTAWGRPGADVRREVERILAPWKERADAPLIRAVTVLRRVVAAVVLRDAALRQRTGSVEYHDMIYLADALLRDEQVQQALLARFHTICVDEFQDTDPAQLRIVRAIVSPGKDPEAGSLFLVGDPKQSIYRFRRADIMTYLQARQDSPDLLKLTTNFRSEDTVIGAVNTLFRHAFGAVEDTEGLPRVPYDDLSTRPEATPNAGSVTLLREEEPTPESEDQDIVAAIRNLHGQELALKDISILCTTHAVARRVMGVLAGEGIPYVSEASTRVYDDEVITQLRTILRAVADPADSFAEVAALRTTLLGSSDEELGARERRGVEKLQAWRSAAAAMTVADLIDMVIADTELPQSLAASGQLERLARVRFVQDHARRFSAETHRDLRDFVRWADQQASSRDGAGDPILDDGTDGVRIMTIHASKGREFEAVILAGMAGSAPSRADRIGIGGDGVIETKIGVPTPGYEHFSARDKAADAAERIRLLYVAATRAKRHLVIPLEIPRTQGGSYAKRVGTPLLLAAEDAQLPVETRPGVTAAPPQDPALQDAHLVDLKRRHRKEALVALHERARHLPRLKATAIVHAGDPDAGLNPLEEQLGLQLRGALGDVVIGTAPVTGRPLASHGSDFGTAVHEVMERITSPDDIADVVPTIAGLNGLNERATADLAAAATSLAETAEVRAALAAGAVREVPVIGMVEQTAVEGVIDLLHRDPDTGGWTIVDYKTDASVTADTVSSYFAQLQLYARLLENTVHTPVTRLVLLFVRDGEVVTRVHQLAQ
jgi:ATP-dependent exoDNAse (exonuclease V) beta subunit